LAKNQFKHTMSAEIQNNVNDLSLGSYHKPTTNPNFRQLADDLRAAARCLQSAAKAAAALLYPKMDFVFVVRHLESMAESTENGMLRLTYLRHNTLTRSPRHPRNAVRARAGAVKSERKRFAAIKNGEKGGRTKTKLKILAARANGAKGGRPRKNRPAGMTVGGGSPGIAPTGVAVATAAAGLSAPAVQSLTATATVLPLSQPAP
jgi:hypothetical protein